MPGYAENYAETRQEQKYQPHLDPEGYQDTDLSAFPDDNRINMTNDVLFRALLQENNHVLKALVCDLLHLDADSTEAVLQSSAASGRSDDFMPDSLRVSIFEVGKHTADVNIQIVNDSSQEERSTLRAALASGALLIDSGQQQDTIPLVQVNIMNAEPRAPIPLFYFTASFRCEQTHAVFTDKFHVVDLVLSRADQATETDKKYRLDVWARLFKAAT